MSVPGVGGRQAVEASVSTMAPGGSAGVGLMPRGQGGGCAEVGFKFDLVQISLAAYVICRLGVPVSKS